jgi:hypothetical protein
MRGVKKESKKGRETAVSLPFGFTKNLCKGV